LKKDTISKEIIKSIVQDISKHILKFEIKDIDFIDAEMQRIESRRADIVAKVNKKFVLHLEIQNSNDKMMPYRMLRYWLDIKRTTDMPIKQFVIYIGKKPLSMKNSLYEDGVNYLYYLIDIRNIDCNDLIAEDTPDSLVLSILCDFKARKPRDIVKYVINRILELTKSDENQFRKYMLMLEELSTNRDLLKIVKEEESMLSDFDLTKLPSYEIGIERGEIQGLKQGIEKGIEQGIEQGKIITCHEFGIEIEDIAKKFNQTTDYVKLVLQQQKGL